MQASAELSVSSWTRIKEPVYSPSLEVLLDWLSTPYQEHNLVATCWRKGDNTGLSTTNPSELCPGGYTCWCPELTTLKTAVFLQLLFRSPDEMSTPAPTMSGIKPPAALAIDKTIREDWRRWKREWTDYCVIQSVNVRPAPYTKPLCFEWQ